MLSLKITLMVWWQGLGTGIILLFATKGVSSRILEFDEQLFFIYLLPPIIFNAGLVDKFLVLAFFSFPVSSFDLTVHPVSLQGDQK